MTRSIPPCATSSRAARRMHHYNYGSTQKGDSRGTEAFGECTHPVFRTHEDTGRKAVYVNRLMTVGVLDMPQEESAPLLDAGLRPGREAGIRLRACLAPGRSAALGQPLLVPRAHRFSLDRAPPDAAHHGQRHGAAVLILHASVQCVVPAHSASETRVDALMEPGPIRRSRSIGARRMGPRVSRGRHQEISEGATIMNKNIDRTLSPSSH